MRTQTEIATAAIQGEEVVYVVLGPFDMGVAATIGAMIEAQLDGSPIEGKPSLHIEGEVLGAHGG